MGSPAAVRVAGEASAEARLGLCELLLASDDAAACAQRAVEWLAEHTLARRSLCALADVDLKRVFGVASQGLPAAEVREFSLDLEDHGHPLARVLNGLSRAYFPPDDLQPPAPIAGVGFHAIALLSRETKVDVAAGLLLVAAPDDRLEPDVEWLAGVLGEKLVRLKSRVTDAASFGRERMLLYSIINAVTDPILLTDTEGKLIIANARAEKLFSAAEDASEGRRRAVALNNMLFSAALSSRAMEYQDVSRHELLLVDPLDGSDLLFELLSTPVRESKDGGVVSILRNVTDLGRASEELRESYRKLRAAQGEVRAERHRLELIIDSVADPIIVTNPAGDVILMNALAEKLFTVDAKSQEESQRLVRANDAHFSSFVSNLLSSGSDLRHRGEIQLGDPSSGAPMPVEAIAGKILSEHGELTAVVTILHDLTEALEKGRLYEQLKAASAELEAKVEAATAELARQNELLRRQHIELEQASAAKTQFLANMSHEIRTPLNAIIGYTSMLLQGVSGELDAPQKRSVTRIDSNSRHLLGLINDILDISRIEAGRMPIRILSFKLEELVAEVVAELEPIIARSKLRVATALSPRVPPLTTDRQKVKQVLVNFLSNSLKFTPQGSVKVSAAYDARAKVVSIAVSDTGIGIAEADQARIFEDFRQLDTSSTRPYGGTGLGLAICKRLALMLDARITVESAPGQGSTFALHLPQRLRRNK